MLSGNFTSTVPTQNFAKIVAVKEKLFYKSVKFFLMS